MEVKEKHKNAHFTARSPLLRTSKKALLFSFIVPEIRYHLFMQQQNIYHNTNYYVAFIMDVPIPTLIILQRRQF